MSALAEPALYPFTIAALILVGLIAFEIVAIVVGLSFTSLLGHAEAHPGSYGELGPLDAWMSWLNRGGVPLLVLIMIMLAAFAIAGFAIQGIAQAMVAPLPTLIASAGAVAIAIPVTRVLSRWTARILPREETSAIQLADLVGLTGRVALGPLDQGKPGQVRVKDLHGNIHVVRAQAAAGHTIPQAANVLLVDQANGVFQAIPAPDELGSAKIKG